MLTQEPFDLHDEGLRRRAVRAAQGLEPFDVLLTGATLVDVATSELRLADIGLVGPLIASVHDAGEFKDAKKTLKLKGKFIAPGLIDTHIHVESSMMTPRRYAEMVVPQGTTTICWDPHEIANVAGIPGVKWAVEASRGLPLRTLIFAPSCVPSAPGLEVSGADFHGAEMDEMLSWPEVAGVAEVMDMRGVLGGDERRVGIVQSGLKSGKFVCGHCRNLKGTGLRAFAAAGIESDHEVTSGTDLLAKLRTGYTIELRGSHDYVLPEAVEVLNNLPHLPQTVTICTDDVFPDDLLAKGGVNDVLRRLVGYGLDAVASLRAATLNAAMRLNRRDLGLVAPGRRADIIVLDDLVSMKVSEVFVSGRHVASNNKMIEELRPDPSHAPRETVKLPLQSPEVFRPKVSEMETGRASLRTIFRPRFTEWRTRTFDVSKGYIDLPEDVLVMAVIHRHGRAPAIPRLALLEDWGLWKGAVATTVAHDSHNLVVYGRNPDDMAAAANAVIASQGGMAVATGGKVIAHHALPVCGLLSEAPATEVAASLAAVRDASTSIADWAPPLRTFKAVVGMALACVPSPHLTDQGLTDGSTGELFESLFVEAAE